MDSTSHLGTLTALFLSSFSGRKSFSAKQVVLAVWAKRWRKRGRAGGLQGEQYRGQGKQTDKEAKTLRNHLFLGILTQIASKRPQAFVQRVAAHAADDANPCPLTGQDFQGEADAEC